MVFEILRIGKENAIPSEYLRQILKFKSVRELQKQIQAERLQGKVILSRSDAPGGYYLPAPTLRGICRGAHCAPVSTGTYRITAGG